MFNFSMFCFLSIIFDGTPRSLSITQTGSDRPILTNTPTLKNDSKISIDVSSSNIGINFDNVAYMYHGDMKLMSETKKYSLKNPFIKNKLNKKNLIKTDKSTPIMKALKSHSAHVNYCYSHSESDSDLHINNQNESSLSSPHLSIPLKANQFNDETKKIVIQDCGLAKENMCYESHDFVKRALALSDSYYYENGMDFDVNSSSESDEKSAESTPKKIYNLRKDNKSSTQHLPLSIEKQLVNNFKNLNNQKGVILLDASLNNNSINYNNTLTEQLSFETISIDNSSSSSHYHTTNNYSRYSDTISLETNHSLNDEDAWLPILNIVEEQV
jgi:hypothetical protein